MFSWKLPQGWWAELQLQFSPGKEYIPIAIIKTSVNQSENESDKSEKCICAELSGWKVHGFVAMGMTLYTEKLTKYPLVNGTSGLMTHSAMAQKLLWRVRVTNLADWSNSSSSGGPPQTDYTAGAE